VGVSAFTDVGPSDHHNVWNSQQQPLEEGLETLSRINLGAMSFTPLANGLLGAITSMNLNVHSDKRILFVMQDGDGQSPKQLKAVQLAKENNIKVVGIGIQWDLDQQYEYDYSIRVDDLSDLNSALFELLNTELAVA